MKQFEMFRLDIANECLWQGEIKVALPPKPYSVLRYLVDHPQRLVTHDELLDALWPDTYVQPQVLRTYILDLRKALGDSAGQPRFIETVPKRGYYFLSSVIDHATHPIPGDLEANNRQDGTARCSPPITLVGREAELAGLAEAFDLVSRRQRQIVFLTGEAGIGKSCLVDAFCRKLAAEATIALGRGQCVEGLGRQELYYPVTEALGALCAGPQGRGTLELLEQKAPDWLPALSRTAMHAQADARSLGALCAALETMAVDLPLILLFEDLQWADPGTLHLISALGRRQASTRLMVIGTCRQEGRMEHPSSALGPLIQDLTLRRLGRQIELAPLTRSEVRALLAKTLEQQGLPVALDSFVHTRSEGNPLFVLATIEHLVAQRFLTPGPHGWQQPRPLDNDELGVPGALTQMIELEVDALTPPEQEILEAGSLLRVVFPAWAAAAALAAEPAEVEELCDRLARRSRFIRRCGEDELPDGTRSAFYVFAHEMYREVLYQRQAISRRAQRHVRIAECLRALFSEREASVAREIAAHYEAAGSWTKAIDAWRLAASHARQRQAQGEAVDLLRHALHLAENMHRQADEVTARAIREELAALSSSIFEPEPSR